jgi:hypothetical protein
MARIYCKTSLIIFTSSATKGINLDVLIFSNSVTTKYDNDLIFPYGLRMSTTSLMETYTNLESRLTTSENCGGGR